MKKKVIAGVAVAAVALSVGATSVASAHGGLGGKGGKGAGLTNLLSDLVSKGTITQSQADAIVKAQTDAKALAEANRPTEAEMQAHRTAEIAVVTSTLGITEATLKSRVQAGESLATIAGTKKDALIAALVAFETKEIDARVTAGKLTAAQATAAKANLTAMVTEKVNNARPRGEGRGGHGKGRGGLDGKGPQGGSSSGGTGGLVVPGTGTTSTAKYTSGLTIKA
jgi:polyhydroxyalkanoate synthesis regulator phasin